MSSKHRNRREESIRRVLLVMILGLVVSGCAPIDPQLAEQIRLLQAEEFYLFAPDNPLCTYAESFPVKSLVPDPQPSFTLNPTGPLTIAFGRGSGWMGYNTVNIDALGKVLLLRYEAERGYTGTLHLHADDIDALVRYINTTALTSMHREYPCSSS